MVQLIKYSIIRKIKNFNIIFWPCIFPLIMGTLFYFGFGNMSEADFETVQAGLFFQNILIKLKRMEPLSMWRP